MEDLKDLSHKELYDAYRRIKEYLEFLKYELSKYEKAEEDDSE